MSITTSAYARQAQNAQIGVPGRWRVYRVVS